MFDDSIAELVERQLLDFSRFKSALIMAACVHLWEVGIKRHNKAERPLQVLIQRNQLNTPWESDEKIEIPPKGDAIPYLIAK